MARKVQGITVVLRRGYTLRTPGSTALYHGPCELVVDQRTARLHLHKFDNTAEIREALGLPPIKERFSTQALPLDAAIQRAEAELARLRKQQAEAPKEARR